MCSGRTRGLSAQHAWCPGLTALLHPLPPTRASPQTTGIFSLIRLKFFIIVIAWKSLYTPSAAVTPECQAQCLIPPDLCCPHFTDEETEPWGGQGTGQDPTASGRYEVLGSRPAPVTPPVGFPHPLPATSAATCRLACGSRCEASQRGQGAHSGLPRSSCSLNAGGRGPCGSCVPR